jgi:DNA-binding GntR family transcriptional regulator
MAETTEASQTRSQEGNGAVDSAYRHIRQAIITGELAPGAILREAKLAEQIGVSRTPIREALTRLGNEGLVELERFRRGRVASFTREDAAEIFRLRAILEGHGAARAAQRISDAGIEQLERVESEMEAIFEALGWHAHLPEFDRLNNEFHGIIAAAAHSPRLEKILATSLELPASIFNYYAEALEGRTRRTHRQHREIIDALKMRDASWAGKAMEIHLLSLAPRTD